MTSIVGSTRILVVALGTAGDVNPMLGIAAELGRRGREVVFLANPVFERHARAAGLEFFPLGTEADYGFIWDRRTWRWWQCMVTAFRDGWIPSLRPVYEAIVHLAGGSRAAIVANIVAAGAGIAAERLGLPLVLVTPSPLIFHSLDDFPDYGPLQRAPRWLGRTGRRLFYRLGDKVVDRWIGKAYNRVRSEAGLPPARRIFSRWVASGERTIGLWPEWFAAPQSGWPERLVLTGFLNYDRGDIDAGDEAPLPGDLEREPPIVFTCGSAMTHAGAFIEAAAGCGRILGRRVLAITDRPVEVPAALRGRVECISYVPFRRLLPRAAAIVHHGGIGTTQAALAAGIPQVVVPLAFDQFDNAERCERLGVALRVPRRRLRPRRIARALRDLLDSAPAAERCRALRARIDPGAALERACGAIEAAAEGSPAGGGKKDACTIDRSRPE